MIDSYAQLLKISFSLQVMKNTCPFKLEFPCGKEKKPSFWIIQKLFHGQDPLLKTPSFWLGYSANKFRKLS